MAIAIDASSPARVGAAASTSATTAAFDPPVSVLLAVAHGNSNQNTGATLPISDSSGTLTWVPILSNNYSGVGDSRGIVAAAYAVVSSPMTGLTVTSSVSGSTSTNKGANLKVYVLTGVNTGSVLGGSTSGHTASASFTTSGFTLSGTDSLGFVAGTEWNALGTPTSADSTVNAFTNAAISGVAGYKTLGPAGGSATFALNAGAAGTAEWNWISFEIQAAPAATASATGAGLTAATSASTTITTAPSTGAANTPGASSTGTADVAATAGAANTPGTSSTGTADVAATTGVANAAGTSSTGTATAADTAGAANSAAVAVAATAGVGSATGSAPDPASLITVAAYTAAAAGTAGNATFTVSDTLTAAIAHGSAQANAAAAGVAVTAGTSGAVGQVVHDSAAAVGVAQGAWSALGIGLGLAPTVHIPVSTVTPQPALAWVTANGAVFQSAGDPTSGPTTTLAAPGEGRASALSPRPAIIVRPLAARGLGRSNAAGASALSASTWVQAGTPIELSIMHAAHPTPVGYQAGLPVRSDSFLAGTPVSLR